jgi:hypothetical protein
MIAVCPALVIQVWNEYDLRMMREADIRQKVVQVTQQLGEEIGELREGARQMLLTIAQLEPVKLHQTEACRALLSKLNYRFPNYDLLGAAGTDGQIYCTSMPTLYSSVADQLFFTGAMARPGLAVGNYWANPASGQKMINFAQRFDDKQWRHRQCCLCWPRLGLAFGSSKSTRMVPKYLDLDCRSRGQHHRAITGS